MKIYLASAAVGDLEKTRKGGPLAIHNRLLSYYHIWKKEFNCAYVFEEITLWNRRINHEG